MTNKNITVPAIIMITFDIFYQFILFLDFPSFVAF